MYVSYILYMLNFLGDIYNFTSEFNFQKFNENTIVFYINEIMLGIHLGHGDIV